MSDFEFYFLAAINAAVKEREQEMMLLRYGLTDGEPHTLQSIGDMYSLTRERIRQLLKRSMGKIRFQGLRSIKNGKLDQPSAQLILFLRQRIAEFGQDEEEATLDFIEEDLAYLPFSYNLIDLVVSLMMEKSTAIKLRATALKYKARRRFQNRRYIQRQRFKLEALIEDVIWPPVLKYYEVGRFIDHVPFPSSVHGPENKYGQFDSKKLGRKVSFDSLLERTYLLKLEHADSVVYYLEQPFLVNYEFEGKPRKYRPDIFFLLEDGRGIVVEIKPRFNMALQNNLAKWSALRRYCANNGYGLIVTEGNCSIQKFQQTFVRPEVEHAIIEKLRQGPLDWEAFNPLRQQYKIHGHEFGAFVLRHRLKWRLGPFTLKLE